MKAVVSMLLGLIALAFGSMAQAAAPPVSAFARLPAIERAEISPDGSRVALLGGPPGERIIFLAPVDGKDAVTVRLGQVWVRDITWVGNAYLVVNFSMLDKGTNFSNGQEYAYELELQRRARHAGQAGDAAAGEHGVVTLRDFAADPARCPHGASHRCWSGSDNT